jgi:hypothetical protein
MRVQHHPISHRRRRHLALALGATLALASAGIAAAATVTPPPGTPDLAAAVLQPTDLAAGTTASEQAYFTPTAGYGFTAQYSIGYSNVVSASGVRYANITDTVAVGPNSTGAATLLAFEQKVLRTPAGHKLIAESFVKGTPKHDHPKLKDVTFGAAMSAGVGTASVIETVTYAINHTKIHQVLVVFIDGDAYSGLSLTGPANHPAPRADAVTLATSIDTHIQAVLSGATGASGTTGTTGATG